MDRQALTAHYTGDIAEDYDASRMSSKKWKAEQKAVSRLLSGLPPGSSLLDIPVGTGRFIPLYSQLGLCGIGMDASEAMLRQAQDKNRSCESPIRLQKADIFAIPAEGDAFDCAICIRFLNWLSHSDMRRALKELARVSRRHVVVGIRSYCRAPEIGVFSRAFLRQVRRRILPPDRLVVHPAAQVRRGFAEARLTVADTVHIERRADGTDYCFYRLEKK